MNSKLTPFARGLRKRMTDAERRLWKALRGKRLEGLKFRRQQPIGPFIVDFVCFEKKLVVEADGGYHYEGGQKLRDTERDAWLREQGFEILRFKNGEIMSSTEGVVLEILKHVSLPRDRPDGSSSLTGEVTDAPEPLRRRRD